MLCTIVVLATPVAAKQIGTFEDWSAHAEGKGNARTCWIHSKPVKDEGKYSKRGRIDVFVSHIPRENIFNQVQFTAGYTFKKGSLTEVAIGNKKFELFTNGDTAWATDSKDDKAIVSAMRGGAKMIVIGRSSRGTLTKDTYSLTGITAAYKAIGKACRAK
jgi:hypothetical protein